MEGASNTSEGIPKNTRELVPDDLTERLIKEGLPVNTRENLEQALTVQRRRRVLSGTERASNITVYPDVNWERGDGLLH